MVPGSWDFQISWQSAHEGVKVVSPTHRPPLPQEIFLVLISDRGWIDRSAIDRPEGLHEWHHRESNPRPSGFYSSTSTNYVTAWPRKVRQKIPARMKKLREWRSIYTYTCVCVCACVCVCVAIHKNSIGVILYILICTNNKRSPS
jgi:hypothetical protein